MQCVGDGIHVTHAKTDPCMRCGETRSHVLHLHWQALAKSKRNELEEPRPSDRAPTDGNPAATLRFGNTDKSDRITQ